MSLLPSGYLVGVYERLTVADQNIRNLDEAITKFLEPLPTVEINIDNGRSAITQAERDGWGRLQKCASETEVPLAFSIRAGEVIHHLRSCLDHIAWELSDPIKREVKPGRVHFPIVVDWTNEDEVSRYKRQTEFITDPAAKTLIEYLQPAKTDAPKDDLLWMVHQLDIVDKHRSLNLILFAPRLEGPSKVTRDYAPIKYAHGVTALIPILGTAKVYANLKVSLQVTFAQLDQAGHPEPIVKFLSNLANRIREVVGLFGS